MLSVILLLKITGIFVLIFGLIYAFGVVWRVEQRLDISYKFLVLSMISLLLAECLDFASMTPDQESLKTLIITVLQTSAFLFLFISIWLMRNLTKKVGEEEL